MNTLGAIPDMPTFEGEPVPVSRNPLTSGTRPLQLLPLPGTEFPVRYETSAMRGFQTEVWAYEYRIYPGGSSDDTPTNSRRIPRYLAHCHHTFASTEHPHYWRCFLNDRALSDLLLTPWEGEAWRTYPARGVAPAQRRVRNAPPRHMCLLEGMTAKDREEEYDGSSVDSFLSAGDYAMYFSTRLQVRLPKVLEYTQSEAEAEVEAAAAAPAGPTAAAPAGPAGAVLGDVPFPLGMEVVLDPGLGLGSAIIIPADLSRLLHHRSWIMSMPHTCLLRDTRNCARGSGDWEVAEALVLPVRCYGPTPDGGGSTLDEARDLKPDHGFLSWLVTHFNPNTMVFRFEDYEVTPTYEEMCAVMGHHPEQDETPALPPGPRYDLTEIVALCPVYLPDGINTDQGLPLELFLSRVLSMDIDPSWIRACCFLLLNMYAMKNRQPGIGDFRLLTVVRDMQMYHRTVFLMIMGETMCWVRDIALHITNFNVHHRGCPMLLQAWALDKLSLILQSQLI
ncbi:hypothetical protein JCGZ_05974 [Jatropha curcas]|uniref:Aminotransferase-like plant mobile domain-containing protein n=1 Tax=Jatropha curcas TaxID=180498 RepID=A0A067KZ40_JATCU|nr:hypothetical protein JCGZ_05974 [Jatropha curcas]